MHDRELGIFAAAKEIYLDRHCSLHEAVDTAWRLWCGVIAATERTEETYQAVEELSFNARTQRALRNNGIQSVRELIRMRPAEILKLKHVSHRTLQNIEQVLSIAGFKLRTD